MNIKSKISTKTFLAISGANQFGSALTSLSFMVVAVNQFGSAGVVGMLIAYYFGISLGGLVVAYAARFGAATRVVAMVEGLRAIIMLLIAIENPSNMLGIIGAYFAISLLESIYHANRYHYINSVFSNDDEKNKFISTLQAIDSSTSVIGPMIAGALIAASSARVGFFIDAATFMISFMLWIKIAQKHPCATSNKLSLLDGYKIIWQTKPLLFINVARALGNSAFVFWNIFLPIAIIKYMQGDSFSLIQGAATGAFAFGIVIVNIITPSVANKIKCKTEDGFLRVAAIGCIVSIAILTYIYFHEASIPVLVGVAFTLGAAVAGFRTSIIIIGQRVTPKELLHLAIASGDSVVRLFTAFSALVIGMLMQFTGVGLLGWGVMIICFILTFGALVILGRLSAGRLTPLRP
jgi:MFS family permease